MQAMSCQESIDGIVKQNLLLMQVRLTCSWTGCSLCHGVGTHMGSSARGLGGFITGPRKRKLSFSETPLVSQCLLVSDLFFFGTCRGFVIGPSFKEVTCDKWFDGEVLHQTIYHM